MKKHNLLLSIFFILTTFNFAAASKDAPFLRFPAVNSDGSKIAFVYQGDIWKVSSKGGTAVRLTVHEAYDGLPQWSPGDSMIAFSSNRWGNNDLFVINSDGTGIKRITYNSAGDGLNQWSADNSLLFETRRTFRQVEWDSEIYAASPKGGTPERILNATGFMPEKSPDGKFIAFVKGPCRISRENYKGSANKDIWLYDIANDAFTKLTTYEGNDFYPRWGDNSTLYFISSRSGVYNIFKMTLDEKKSKKELKAVTDYADDGIRYFSIGKDGKHIAFERGTDIYFLALNDGVPKKVVVNVASDYKFDPFEHKTFSDKISDYVVSPNGKYSAIEIRGEIFVTENDKEKSLTANVSAHPYRDQNPQWLNDSTIIFVSDRDGQKDLFMVTSANEKEPNLLKCLEYKTTKITDTEYDEDYPLVSPDGKKIAYQIGRGKLVAADIDANGKLTNEVTLLDGWAEPQSPAWSPDSRWIAYALNDLDFNSEIFIRKADGTSDPVNVSMHPRSDRNPVWSPDGSKLAFVSDRNNRNNDIWFVWLNKKDWEKTKQDWSESGDEPKKEKKKKKEGEDEKEKDSKKVKEIKIDVERIWERLSQVTSMAGDETSPAFSKDGKTIFFVTSEPATKGRDLYKIKFDGTKIERITKGGKNPSSLSSAEKGKYLYMLTKGGKLSRLKDGSDKLENVAFSAKMTIDFNAELNQMFEEAWRELRDGFYDPKFHGQDWFKLKDKYKPMALKASTRKDFRDMFNIMLGQVNASHMGLYGDDRAKTQKEKTGLLGVEIKPLADGIQIERVIPKSPADRDTSKLNAGDKIISVNGKPVNINNNFYAPLVNEANERVMLKVKSGNGEERTVVIRPAASLSSQLYDEWVENERKLTDKYSGGKLGYIHIKAMGWTSFERFERELAAAGYGKEGIVIDVRYNGGGWTTDYLMTVLNYNQHAYTIPRGAAKDLTKEHLKFRDYYPFAERLPYAVWTKPSIAMCNESSYSNAEIFSHAYKTLGIGKLVGVPTFGAVISTGGKGLIDGSYVRLPFRGWFVKATDENMEFDPAVPQYIVENAPDSKVKGKDEQLKKAVEELLKELK